MERIICLVIGYACGLLQSGYLVGKMHHIDIRKAGSGNSGSTNALRVMGLKAGLMTFAGDVLKCFAAVLIVRAIYHGSNILPLLMMYAGAGVTLGHNFPFYMNFKGGKGIAVMAALVVSNCFCRIFPRSGDSHRPAHRPRCPYGPKSRSWGPFHSRGWREWSRRHSRSRPFRRP